MVVEHHPLARMLNPPCSPCSTHRAQHRWEPVPAAPLPGGWDGVGATGLGVWGAKGDQDSQEQQRPCLRTPSSMVRQKLQ